MRRLLAVSALALASPVAIAQEPLTKEQIIDRSAGICRDLNEDALPHVRRMTRSDSVNEAVRHGRRFIRTSRPYVRELADLKPSAGRLYDRFVNNTWTALDWLGEYLDAVEARRGALAERRGEKVGNHAQRARRAAKRYGLRRSCIVYVS
jgi:hypothetical protein